MSIFALLLTAQTSGSCSSLRGNSNCWGSSMETGSFPLRVCGCCSPPTPGLFLHS